MTITLDAQTEELIQQELASGHYASANELVSHALRLLHDDDTWTDADRNAFTALLDERMASIDRGEGLTEAQAREQLQQMRAARQR